MNVERNDDKITITMDKYDAIMFKCCVLPCAKPLLKQYLAEEEEKYGKDSNWTKDTAHQIELLDELLEKLNKVI